MKITENLYEVLEVSPFASKEEIRKAFCAKVKSLHPDCTGCSSEQFTIELQKVLHAYRTLMDDAQRSRYNKTLFYPHSKTGKHYIPQKRIRYSISLVDLLKKEFLPKKMRRKDILHEFDHDIEIVCTKQELHSEAVALIQIPSRIVCPLCYGTNRECYVCNGVGRISSTSTFEITLPKNITTGTIVTIDLSHYRPDIFTDLTVKYIRIKFTIQ